MKQGCLKGLYTISVMVLPFFSLYRGVVNAVDLGTTLVLILFLLNLGWIYKRVKVEIPREWIVYACYAVIITIFMCLIQPTAVSPFMICQRLIKNMMYVFVLLISIENEFFLFDFSKKVYLFMTILATVYVYFQVIAARMFNTILWGYIPGLVGKMSYVEDIRRTAPSTFRPSSLFYEPSHYFIYVFASLIFLLFSEKKCRKKQILLAAFVSSGIILSTTSMGILFVALVWGLWLGWQFTRCCIRRKIEIMLLFVSVAFVGAIIVAFNSTRVVNALARVFDAGYEGGNAIAGRGTGYYEILHMPIHNFIFGYGYGNVGNNYYPSIAFNFLCLGTIGSLLVFIIFYNMYNKLYTREEKLAFIAYIALCFYGEIFMSHYLLFFMSMFMRKKKKMYRVDEKYKEIGDYDGKTR